MPGKACILLLEILDKLSLLAKVSDFLSPLPKQDPVVETERTGVSSRDSKETPEKSEIIPKVMEKSLSETELPSQRTHSVKNSAGRSPTSGKRVHKAAMRNRSRSAKTAVPPKKSTSNKKGNQKASDSGSRTERTTEITPRQFDRMKSLPTPHTKTKKSRGGGKGGSGSSGGGGVQHNTISLTQSDNISNPNPNRLSQHMSMPNLIPKEGTVDVEDPQKKRMPSPVPRGDNGIENIQREEGEQKPRGKKISEKKRQKKNEKLVNSDGKRRLRTAETSPVI